MSALQHRRINAVISASRLHQAVFSASTGTLTNMNLRQLGYFLKIADLRNFTSAASALFVSQPALSRQMRQLEDELGTALFIRSDRGVKLTDAGELLKRRCPAILSDITHLRNELQASYAHQPRGQLTVGVGMSMQAFVTIPTIADYQARYPEVCLMVREGLTGPLVEDVKLGLLDCALVFELEPYEQILSEPYVRESLLLVGPRDCGLRPDCPVEAAEALSFRLITTGGDSPLRTKTQTTAAALGIEVKVAFETNAVAVMVGCVEAGGYYAILPYSAIGGAVAARRLAAAPIIGMSLDWTFIYARNFGLSLAARTFRTLLFERADALTSEGNWRFATRTVSRDAAAAATTTATTVRRRSPARVA